MSFSGKLRSNWRAADEAGDLGNVLLGSNVVAGSFMPQGLGGASFVGGGFVMGSFASLLNAGGWVGLSAQGVISAFYGTTPGLTGSGWRWIPFMLQEASINPTFEYNYQLSATQALSAGDSVVIIRVAQLTITGSPTASTYNAYFATAGGVSVRFIYAGWIVSAAA